MRYKLTKTMVAFIGAFILFILAPSFSDAQNLMPNGDFSSGLQGWTVVPTGETTPWPLVDGGANLHPVVNSGYTGTIIYQDLNIVGVAGKSYSFSMKLLKTGTPDDAWRTVAVYLTYTDGGSSVRYKLTNPLNGEISTPVSLEGIPTFTGTIAASIDLPSTATAITKIEFAKETYGDFTVDDIVLTEGSAPCTFTVVKAGSVNPVICLGPSAGTATLNITASSPACAWSASVTSGADWLSIVGAASGTGSGQLQVTAAANPSATGIPRAASVSLGAGQGFMLQQLASPLPRSVVSLGPLQNVRAGNHTATMLMNGKVLIVGGHTNVGITDVLATAELYDPQTRRFTLTGSLHVPRWGHTATLLSDGKVLVAGGYNYEGASHTNLDTAEIYDPSTGQFTLLASKMHSPRRQHTATAFPDPTTKAMKILIAGGIANGGAGPSDTWSVSNTADIYDVTSGVFTAAGNLIAGRGTHWASLVGETKILIAGGSDFTNYLASAEIYDTTTGGFTSTGSMATGRAHGVAGFQIAVGGGLTNGQTCLASTELFNVKTGAFSTYATLNQARRGHEITPLSPGRILVSGGDCAGNPTMEILDLSTDVFTTASQSMTAPRVFHTATYLPGATSPEYDILIVGGDAGGTAELYTTSTVSPTTVTLTVAKAGGGSGTVTSAPAGINCGAACSASFSIGASVTLTAAAASGSTFTGWSGGGCSGTGTCTVAMDAAKTVTATFAAQPTGGSTLPKTGQTACYNAAGTEIACAGTGQDGDYQTGAAWPSPRFTDNGDGTITDRLTGLVWLKNAGCEGFVTFVPWSDSLRKTSLLAHGQCGLTDGSQVGDWRLPNINEIKSLLTNAGQSDMTTWLTGQGFTNVGTFAYWSSTPYAQSAAFCWEFDLQTPKIYAIGSTPGVSVWPVRDGQTGGVIALPRTGQTASAAAGDDGALQKGTSWPSPRFTDNGDGTVTDRLTNLIWLKKANCASQTKSWSDALAYAAGLTAGQCDIVDESRAGEWRLPNLNELQSLIDRGKYSPALPDGHPFTGVEPNMYWTSTSSAKLTSHAWQVNLNTGIGYPVDKSDAFSNAYVWPVRTAPAVVGSSILTVAKTGEGSGTVTSAPAGIDCGAACSASFSIGASVTLTAAAASGSTFTGWSGGGCSGMGTCTATMDAAKTITATFQANVETQANAGPDSVVFDRAVLDGSASQGNIVSWNWTLTHRTNSAWSRTATGQKPELSALQPGFYDVTLTVTDSASQTRTADMVMAVAGPWDTNKDGTQGLAEVIYLLQLLAGVR